jgi:hypothetical protein
MSTHDSEPDEIHDQDAEPSLNSPEEGRPDGIQAETNDKDGDQVG